MKSFYEEAISIIKNNNPALFKRIVDAEASDRIKAEQAGKGDFIPAVNLEGKKIYVHSRFDPFKEAARLISEVDAANFDLFIIFGFGFAYHIQELIKRIGIDSIILVIEKDPAMLKCAVSFRDLSGILSDARLKVLVDPDEDTISEVLKGKSSRRVAFLTHRGSYQIDPEYYGNITGIANSYLSAKEVNIATLSKFEKTWASNIARNIERFVTLPGANIFYDRFAGLPAVVAGAGPSLNDSMEFIRNNQNKAVIICVDTSYSILRKKGIKPHFCVTVDPQVINARYFEGDSKGDTIFIADPAAHPSVFRLIKGKAAITGMAFEMMKWLETISGEKGELAYGGSVTINAYDFAKRTGASPVIMVGQDLAFTKCLAHARGSYLDEEVFLNLNRFYNAHMKNRFQLTALPRIKVSGIRTPDIFTNQKLMIFHNWFEKRNDPDLINASYDGAFINGIKHIPSEKVTIPDTGKNITGLAHEIYGEHEAGINKIQVSRESLLNKCRGMVDELNSLSSVLTKAVSLSGNLISLVKEENKSPEIDYILKKLSGTDNILYSKDTLKEMIGFTIQRVIHTINEGYDIDAEDAQISREEMVAKRSNFLYKGILEGTEFNIKILRKMIRLLEADQ